MGNRRLWCFCAVERARRYGSLVSQAARITLPFMSVVIMLLRLDSVVCPHWRRRYMMGERLPDRASETDAELMLPPMV